MVESAGERGGTLTDTAANGFELKQKGASTFLLLTMATMAASVPMIALRIATVGLVKHVATRA
jgi:hypothetical protein